MTKTETTMISLNNVAVLQIITDIMGKAANGK